MGAEVWVLKEIKIMKIGILTQPLHNNYGGLLQNFALQTTLKKLGHESQTINIKNRENLKLRKYASLLKRTVLKLSGQKIRVRAWPTEEEKEIISKYTQQFIKKNITTTDLITKKLDEKLIDKYSFDAYIVGSDQVWRPKYSPHMSTFFLDFLENNYGVKKIAFAASFGVDDWEFTEPQTKEYKRLIKLFNAISVREDTAVELCKKHFGVDAAHMLDPTMLLARNEYISLVEKEKIEKSSGNLFTYILDSTNDKNSIIEKISNKYNLKAFSVMQPKRFSDIDRNGIDECVFPPVEEWIRGFMDAEFVVTDSFHGTVFSIIFNKPFISIANESRGTTRFTSLLKMFNLENRLIFSPEELNLDKVKEIDWGNVNEILEQDKERAIFFLKRNLL
jgi:polysaccharide pyruvyl transferase WcaK-like protein